MSRQDIDELQGKISLSGANSRWGLARLTLLLAATILPFVVVPFLIWGEDMEAWTLALLDTQATGVAASIGGTLLAADILLPIPSSAIGVMLGATLGFAVGTLVGTLGLSAGCVIGYALGRGAVVTLGVDLRSSRNVVHSKAALSRYGIAILALLRPVPVLAEASVIAAGALRVPLAKFVAVTVIANLLVSAAYAAIGATIAIGTAAYLLVAAVVLVSASIAAKYLTARPSRKSDSSGSR